MKKNFMLSAIILLIIGVFGFFLLYVLNNGNPYTNYLADKKIPKYLERKGYSVTDIEQSHYIETKHTINKNLYHGHYMVIFKDETDMTYYYGITKDDKQIKQFCEKDKLTSEGFTDIIESKTKHSELDCIKSLDNRD